MFSILFSSLSAILIVITSPGGAYNPVIEHPPFICDNVIFLIIAGSSSETSPK